MLFQCGGVEVWAVLDVYAFLILEYISRISLGKIKIKTISLFFKVLLYYSFSVNIEKNLNNMILEYRNHSLK